MLDCPHCGDTHHVNDFCATGPMSSQPSTPMTHPLTPREWGADDLLFFKLKDLITEQSEGEWDDAMIARDALHFANHLRPLFDRCTALASGSGDHAELVKAIERLLPIGIHETPDYAGVSFGECQAQAMTMEPETWLALNQLPALLAEIEALRAKAGLADVLGEKLERRTFALDEAERKLAEAREIIQHLEWSCEQLAATRSQAAYDQMISDGQAQALLELDNARRAARTFISKEAERG